jgi:hypothetical protein
MKKQIALISFALLAAISISQAQTKTSNKLGKSLKLSKNDSLMCAKEWKVVSIEEEGVKNKPGEKNKNDMLSMSLDGRYNLVLSGNKKAGTWNRAGQFIYFADTLSGEKFSYKVVNVEPKKVKVDYQEPGKGHSIFEMKPR